MAKNYCVKFAKRPGVNGIPEEDNFYFSETCYPDDISENEVMIKTLYLSVDPAQRCQMNEDSGADYLKAFQIDEIIPGLLGVGVVTESKTTGFHVGDIVINKGVGGWPWQLFFSVSAAHDKLLVVQVEDPKLELTYYGISGLTSLIGLQEKGHISDNNGAGKCVVVSGAAGSCGHLVGQFALVNGCGPVVGICGSDEKCDVLTNRLNFNGAINYKTEDIDEKLKGLCPNGVDVYFDNVGGDISDIVINNMKVGSHVVLCGQISQYNKDVEYPPPLKDEIKDLLSERNITRERFMVLMYPHKFEQARKEMHTMKSEKKIQILENVYDGLELVGKAFCDMMKGKNIGKQIVQVSQL